MQRLNEQVTGIRRRNGWEQNKQRHEKPWSREENKNTFRQRLMKRTDENLVSLVCWFWHSCSAITRKQRPVRSCDRWGNSARRDPRDKNTFVVSRPRRLERTWRSAEAFCERSRLEFRFNVSWGCAARQIRFDRSRRRLIDILCERSLVDHASSRIYISHRECCVGLPGEILSLSWQPTLVTLFANARSLQGWNQSSNFCQFQSIGV